MSWYMMLVSRFYFESVNDSPHSPSSSKLMVECHSLKVTDQAAMFDELGERTCWIEPNTNTILVYYLVQEHF